MPAGLHFPYLFFRMCFFSAKSLGSENSQSLPRILIFNILPDVHSSFRYSTKMTYRFISVGKASSNHTNFQEKALEARKTVSTKILWVR